MRDVLRRVRAFIGGFWRALRHVRPAPTAEAIAFLDDLFNRFPFTREAEQWLRDLVSVEVRNLGSVRGGGLFFPGQNRVQLHSGQYEAAIHELAHAWWHPRRLTQREAFIAAVVRAAHEPEPAFSRTAELAHGYVYGLPEVGFPGFLQDRNDWEMFAGMASGCMADLRRLPPYLRPYFDGLFRLLPPEYASPESSAPHL